MGELKQMTERIGFEGFIEYLMYGGETGRIPAADDGKDAYQKRIDAAFEELFDAFCDVVKEATVFLNFGLHWPFNGQSLHCSRRNDTLHCFVLPA